MNAVALEDVKSHPGYTFLLLLCEDGYDDRASTPWPDDWIKDMIDLANKVGCMGAFRAFLVNAPKEWKDPETRGQYVRQRRYGFMGIVTSHLANVNKEMEDLNKVIKALIDE